MEVPNASEHKMGVYMYEGLGTALLIMGINWSSGGL